jgi:hypothetical protein
VVDDDPVAIGELWFRQERDEPICQDRRDEEQGLARSPHVVLELYPVDCGFVHTRYA